MTWTQGRRLESIAGVAEYTYDMSGVRTSKTVGTTTYNYVTQNGQVVRQTWAGNTLDIVYDNNNQPYYCIYTPDGGTATVYYYITNLQGDVVRLVNTSGTTVASYTYNAWGKCTVGTNTTQDIANVNPIRYRGYYYDTETGFYYLQSRYYDPEICRFINADAPELSEMTAYNVGDSNMFAYCGNNPVAHVDTEGELFWSVIAGAATGAACEIISSLISGSEIDVNRVLTSAVIGAASGATGIIKFFGAAFQFVDTFTQNKENGMGLGANIVDSAIGAGLSYFTFGKQLIPNTVQREICDAVIGSQISVVGTIASSGIKANCTRQRNTSSTGRNNSTQSRTSNGTGKTRIVYRLVNGKLIKYTTYV